VKRQTLTLVVIGVLLFIAGGGIAFVSVVKGSKNHTPTPPQTAATITLPAVVAIKPIPAGTTGAAMVNNKLVAIQQIPQKSFLTTDVATFTALTDEVVTTTLAKGAVLQAGELTASTTVISLPTGDDGITVSVSAPEGLAGYLQPGDQIDLYADVSKLSADANTGKFVPAGTPIPCTALIAPDITVIDVSDTSPAFDPHAATTTATTSGSSTAPTGPTARVIPTTLTLLLAVTPAEAQTVAFMSSFEGLYVAETQKSAPSPAPTQCLSTGNLITAP
jgi:Flp pilus assembly protein CpaB